MTKRRKTDPPKLVNHYRTDRMVEHEGKWYFYTREGTFHGPWDGEMAAEEALRKYIAAIESGMISPEGATRLGVDKVS